MSGQVTVVGLGPGPAGLVTLATRDAVAATPARFLRTARHPSAHVVEPAASFDHLYEGANSFDEVYAAIVATLVEAAGREGDVLYAVPGSPLVAERTVELLRAETAVVVRVLPALSFVDLAWARLGVDPFAAGARLVDGRRFATEAAGQIGPLLVAQCDRPHVLSDIKLAVDEDPGPVVVLQRLGLPDEEVTEVAWSDLDRAVEPDHLTCLWIPRLAAPVAGDLVRLAELMEILRQRCPWDRAQDHRSLVPYLVEEAYEVVDAIEALPAGAGAAPGGEADAGRGAAAGAEGGAQQGEDLENLEKGGLEGGDPEAWAHLEEELGDLLFQVVFHARLGAEAGQFDLADVARGVHDKLVVRHPHVFGAGAATSVDQLDAAWEARKKQEKGRASVTDGIPAALPAAAYAQKLQRKAASLGLDWHDADGVWTKLEEELTELRAACPGSPPAPGGSGDTAGELGDVLFTVVNLARKLGVDAELALRGAATRFRRRVVLVEEAAEQAGVEPAAAGEQQLDRWWELAKARLAGPSGERGA